MRVVVAGAGMAGLRSAEALRKAGFAGEVTVIGAEPHMPYNRPPLSKDAIGADFDGAQLPFRIAKAAGDVVWRLGEPVAAASLTARTVTLADGTMLDWDGLIAATGVRSRRLPLPGPEAGRHAVRTHDDLKALRADLDLARTIVVVGGGFIGCEVAAAARTRGLDVTVVEPEPLPMRRPLGDELATALLRRHEAHGVRFLLGTAPVAYQGGTRVRGVALNDGTTLDADLVVESVGSIPNVDWLAGNGLDLTDGVLSDAALRVLVSDGAVSNGAVSDGIMSDGAVPAAVPAPGPGGGGAPVARADVFAVGDVARYPHPLLYGASRRIEHWTVATDTAKHAGAALARHLAGSADTAAPFAAVPTFWSDQYEMRIQSFGVTGLPDARVLEGSLGGDVAVGYHHAGQLAGVVLIGLGGRYTTYRTQVQETIRSLA